MSYECRRSCDKQGRARKKKKPNDSLTVKTVYIIPSYIFSHMIVHMLGILNGMCAGKRISFGRSVDVCSARIRDAEGERFSFGFRVVQSQVGSASAHM